MLGAQALVATRSSSGAVNAYTSPISAYTTSLAQAPLSFNVSNNRAEFTGGEMVIHATLQLPSGRSTFNQVWQQGPISGSTPGQHNLNSENTNAVGSIDFSSGQTGSGGVVVVRRRRKNVGHSINLLIIAVFENKFDLRFDEI